MLIFIDFRVEMRSFPSSVWLAAVTQTYRQDDELTHTKKSTVGL
jgi:hypothetical protein